MSKLLTRFRTYMARRAQVNKTINELASLTDRELSDLGIHRSQIRSVAMYQPEAEIVANENENLEGSV